MSDPKAIVQSRFEEYTECEVCTSLHAEAYIHQAHDGTIYRSVYCADCSGIDLEGIQMTYEHLRELIRGL
jgi:hypothetical protein